MANEQMNIFIHLKDEISKGLENIKKNITGVGTTTTAVNDKAKRSWLELAGQIYISKQAIDLVVKATRASLDAFAEQEEAVTRLNYAIQLNGENYQRVSLRYVELANTIQRTTKFSDDAVLQSMQTLISLGKVTEENMSRAIRATLDFASATGRDLNSAALLVSKAMQGSTMELRRYGIIVEEGATKSEKMENALKALESRFRGFAENDLKTFNGQMAQLNNAWSDLLETIGEVIAKSSAGQSVISGLTKRLQTMADVISQPTDELGKLQKELRGVNREIEHIQQGIKNSMGIGLGTFDRELQSALERQKNLIITIQQQRKAIEQEASKDLQVRQTKQEKQDFLQKEVPKAAGIQSVVGIFQERQKDVRKNLEPIMAVVKVFNKVRTESEREAKFIEGIWTNMASRVHDTFSEFIYKSITGEVRSMKDLFRGLGGVILQTFSQLAAAAVLKSIFKGTSFGGFLGFATGTPYVPKTGLYMLHQGERVTTRHQNESGGGGGGGMGGVTVNVNMAVQAWDAQDVYRNRKILADSMGMELANNGQFRDTLKRFK